ncbi:MAG: hypothetical protein M3R13_00470 [Armatimonadota bacterium]|nr:hypothetical protein [Armatimonadota bacterium]
MRFIFFASCCLASCCAFPAGYEVSFDLAGSSATVRIRLDDAAATDFHMPAWSPGDYRIVDYGKHVTNVRFTRLGDVLSATHPSVNHWKASAPADMVEYRVSTQRAGIFSENFRLTADEVFVHGPAVFGYFAGHQREKQSLGLTPYPGDGAQVAIGLTGIKKYTFLAKDYDELVDSPFAMGSGVRSADFVVGGKLHQVAAFGTQSAGVALGPFVEVGQKVATACLDIFGELPYDKYVFLFDFGGGGGGLEHANSARMSMWPGGARDAAGFIAHEFFHAFNVKRIRPRVLGPFDYTKPAVTGALWWLEGVTDYYAQLITVRAGMATRESAMRSLSSEYRAFQRMENRLKVSADESSRRVWEAKNSSGYGINYYTKGKLIGWVLDLAIRGETGGKKSLDDVMRALYAETKGDKPGFAETRIRELCVQIGGEALGPIYDDCVIKPVDLPIAGVLPGVGMQLLGGIVRDDPAAKSPAGAEWPMR